MTDTPESVWGPFGRLAWFIAGTGGLAMVLFSQEPGRDLSQILVMGACFMPDWIDRWLDKPGRPLPALRLRLLIIVPCMLLVGMVLMGWLWWPSATAQVQIIRIGWAVLWGMTVIGELAKWWLSRKQQKPAAG